MTVFRMDVSRKSGRVVLWMETPWGLNPIVEWADVDGVREFAEMLLGFHDSITAGRNNRIEEVSDNLLRQALGDEEYFEEES